MSFIRPILILLMVVVLSSPAFAAAGKKMIFSEGCFLSTKNQVKVIKSGSIVIYVMKAKQKTGI